MDSLDKLLAEIKSEYEKVEPEQQIKSPLIQPSAKSTSPLDQLLTEIREDFAAQDAAENLKRQQEVEQEEIRQKQIKAEQMDSWNNQAKEWLAELDPFSVEGLWFEKFAEKYPSKLAAAIEYLQINKSSS